MKKEYTLKDDLVFKTIFSDPENAKWLLENTLGLKIKKLKVINPLLDVQHVHERQKNLDLVVETEDGVINVELNHYRKEWVLYRNYAYFNKLVGSSIERNQNYIYQPCLQVNYTWELQSYKFFLEEDISNINHIDFQLKSSTSNRAIWQHDKIVMFNMDYYERACYNKCDAFKLLCANSTKELQEISAKGDERMKIIANEVKRLNRDKEFLKCIELKDDYERGYNTDIYIAKTEGQQRGIEIGEQRGIEIGQQQGLKIGQQIGQQQGIENTAVNMLKENINVELISKVTGLSTAQISLLQF